ncbi:MAG: 16S rRNA (cytosine(1402)-N(4))-methyltransferase RsmH [Bacteroidota bacterium]
MTQHQSQHIPVMANEVLEKLDIKEADVVIDGTINGGGHASLFAGRLGKDGILVGIDQDSRALAVSANRIKNTSCKVHLVHGNFRDSGKHLKELGIEKCTKLFLDLGWSSNQLATTPGLSFQKDTPLSMVLEHPIPKDALDAATIVNTWPEPDLISLFEELGDEEHAKEIVEKIVLERIENPITTTFELKEIIWQAVPGYRRAKRTHPATKVFQALRIVVNKEFTNLQFLFSTLSDFMASSGIVGILTFHSTEDRIVKKLIREYKEKGIISRRHTSSVRPKWTETQSNKRSRSAKLRTFHII